MQQPQAATVDKTIKVRNPELGFDASIPRHWLADNALATHLSNGINLLFPAGERFFVRSVRYYVNDLTSAQLREKIKGFFGQEGRHAQAHERFFEVLKAQGFALGPFLRFYDFIAFELIESLSPRPLRLAATVACEHFTAILAENALRDRFLDHAHPALRDLLFWHAAEEIEHRAVAFDVLHAVHPSYPLRMAGLALATLTLAGFWLAATCDLLRQDDQVDLQRLRRDVARLRENESILRKVFVRGIRAYARRDFHPSQSATDELAANYLARAGLV